MQRTIIHINVSDFHVAVERVLQPHLRNRPLLIAVQASTRALVFALSREAAEAGIRCGMPLAQAVKFCPDVTVLPPNEDLYVRATAAMLQILGRFSPLIEPLRFGHAYLDMTGCGKLYASVKDAAAKAQQELYKRLQLPASAGVASNKLVSKVASDVVTQQSHAAGLYDVQHGSEAGFLAPLHIGYLPGVKQEVRGKLWELNIRLIRELAALSSENLQMVFGRFGVLLHQRSLGIDNRPVLPLRRLPEVVETEELAQDSNDFALLYSLAFRLLTRGMRRVRWQYGQAGRLVLEIRYTDFKEEQVQQKIPPELSENELAPVLLQLLQRALARRVRVRKITLRLGGLQPVPAQLSLFGAETESKQQKLLKAMDRICRRYGEQAIYFGRAA
jgi:DNA polymerase IV